MNKEESKDILYHRYLPKLHEPTADLRKSIFNMIKIVRDHGNDELLEKVEQKIVGLEKVLMKGIDEGRAINVIQIQNIQIAQIFLEIMNAFDKCDDLDNKFKESQNKSFEFEFEKALEIVVEKCLESEMTHREFHRLLTRKLVEKAIEISDSDSKASKRLGMQRTYICKLKRKFVEEDEKAMD